MDDDDDSGRSRIKDVVAAGWAMPLLVDEAADSTWADDVAVLDTLVAWCVDCSCATDEFENASKVSF